MSSTSDEGSLRVVQGERALSSGTEGLWKVKDVADFLAMSVSWVYKEVEAGKLPCVRIGAALRFRPDDIRAYLDGQRAPRGAVVALRR
jgi:excisionase family DNA binding protein